MTARAKAPIERIAWALLCALVFSLPLEKGIYVPGFGTVSRAIGVAAFAAGATAIALRRRLRPPNAALLLAGVFVLWSGLTWCWSYAPSATATRFATMAQLLGMVWLIWELCRTGAAQIQLLEAYLAGAAASSVWTIVRAAANKQTNWRRFATAGFDPNDLGVTFALALAFALYLGLRTTGWRAALVWTAALLANVGLLLTASRTALLAALVSGIFILLTWRRSTVIQRLCQIGLLLLLVLGALRLAPSSSRARLATLPTEVAGGTFHNRTRIWKAGAKLLKHRPIRGVGAGAYPEAVVPYLGRSPIKEQPYTAHNTFLSVLVETGAVGFLLWGLLMAACLWFCWLMEPVEGAMWFTALLVWATGVFTLSWESRKPTWLMIGLIMTAWARAFDSRESKP